MQSHSLFSISRMSVHMKFKQAKHKPSPKCFHQMPGSKLSMAIKTHTICRHTSWKFPWWQGQENWWWGWQRERRNEAESHLWIRKMKWKWKLSGRPPGIGKSKLFLSLPRLSRIMLNYRSQCIHVHNLYAIQPVPTQTRIGFPVSQCLLALPGPVVSSEVSRHLTPKPSLPRVLLEIPGIGIIV